MCCQEGVWMGDVVIPARRWMGSSGGPVDKATKQGSGSLPARRNAYYAAAGVRSRLPAHG